MSYSLSLNRFSGKVAVVTGASAGIGKAIVEGLVKYGVVVAGVARRAERVEKLAKELGREKGKLIAYQCDLTNKNQILATFKRITTELGPIHILINNAGVLHSSTIIDGDIDKWKLILDTNILAVAICMREAIASMKAHNIKGHIINVNSVLGHTVTQMEFLNMYPASKYAITGLTETTRLEINREKLPIKITSLSPGYVRTELPIVAFGKMTDRPGLVSEDIADAAFYILSTPENVNVKELTIHIQGHYS